MSIKLTKRIAADLLDRGVSSIRIGINGVEDAKKAITREDVRKLIKEGNVYAIAEKRNVSRYSKELREKRHEGRKRGTGSKHGTRKARASIDYKKKVRAQRRLLAALKNDKTIDNEMYKGFYRLVKGGVFPSKASLLMHITGKG
ncbi:MAG: 50S ribosomal protein L19e, partial [Candidatus Marsarchaeota archaeon]|nr:50S ribosomal protein L19e [Candidatus Marsarchaeota archaeon]